MKVLVSGAEKDLGAHIPQIEEVLVPNFTKAAERGECKAPVERGGCFELSAEDYEMWKKVCDASDDTDGLYKYCTEEYGWTLY